MKKYSFALKIAIALLPILLIGWIIEQNLALSGINTFTYSFEQENPIISGLEPWQRLSEIKKSNNTYSQEMRDDIIYFKVKKINTFEKITTTIEYANPNAKLVDIGMSINKKNAQKKLPLESKLIDNLDWSRINSNNVILLQKEENFNSIEEFFSSFPSQKKVGVYNFNLQEFVNSEALIKENVLPLRHFHTENDFDYIITRYETPVKNGGTVIAKNTFNAVDGFIDTEGNYRFSISAPGLKESSSTIEIKEITVQFEKQPITTEDISNKLKSFFNLQ